MDEKVGSTLTLLVTNAQLLESGLKAQSSWSASGGTIGSDPSTTWQLKDSQGQIQPLHCQILMVDGAFCVKDLSGATFVNGSHLPLGKEQMAKLEYKDELIIGPYTLRVILGGVDEHDSGSLDTIFQSQDTDLLADTELDDGLIEESMTQGNVDPIVALNELHNPKADEEALFQEPLITDESNHSLIPKKNLVLHDPKFTPQADSEYEMASSIRLKKILGFRGRKASTAPIAQNSIESTVPNNKQTVPTMKTNNESESLPMDDQELDLLEEEVAKSLQPAQTEWSHSNQHLLTGPMLSGLGVDLGIGQDMKHLHLLSQELGESLQACVKGLLALHQQVNEGRFGTLNRNLQPIEDNPLRLGLEYDETVRTMYDTNKSLVHLSAPAAIAESLKNVRDHNEAMQYATSEALNQILNAFSPQVLLRRFHHYKRNTDQTSVSEEAWAWDMYCNYYQELTSNRQQGFEKLFWEIFEQTYDKRIREKQREL